MKKHLILFVSMLIAMMSFGQTQQGYVKTKGRMVNGKHVPGQGLKGATVTIQGRTAVLVGKDDGSFSFPIPAQTFVLQSVQKKRLSACGCRCLEKVLQLFHQSHLFSNGNSRTADAGSVGL